MNTFFCGRKDHKCNDLGKPVLLLYDSLYEIEDNIENQEKYKDQICGGSVTCSICGKSAISEALWH